MTRGPCCHHAVSAEFHLSTSVAQAYTKWILPFEPFIKEYRSVHPSPQFSFFFGESRLFRARKYIILMTLIVHWFTDDSPMIHSWFTHDSLILHWSIYWSCTSEVVIILCAFPFHRVLGLMNVSCPKQGLRSLDPICMLYVVFAC